jgi:excisionase family DNA binding protein
MKLDEQSVSSEQNAYTILRLAKKWGVSEGTIYNRIRDGSLQVFHIGRLVRIRADVVEALERGQQP